MSTPTILLLHEEGPGIGLGHKYRMVALRVALIEQGADVYLDTCDMPRLFDDVDATVIDARTPQAWPYLGQRVCVELDGTVRWDDGWSVGGPDFAMIRKGFRTNRRRPGDRNHKIMIWQSAHHPDPRWPDVNPGREHTETPWEILKEYAEVYCPASMRALEASCMGLRVHTYAYDDATRTIKQWLDNGSVIDGYGAERVAKLILKRL